MTGTEIETSDKLEVAAHLAWWAAQRRYNGLMPPPAFERVAEILLCSAALDGLSASEFGSDHRQDGPDRETFRSVDEASQALGITPRAMRYQCALGKVPGARRVNPKKKSAWQIPDSFVATQIAKGHR